MNNIKIGNYIMKKRKELNLTQEQLAEKSMFQVKLYLNGNAQKRYQIIQLLKYYVKH